MNYSKNHSISKKLAKSTLWISLAAILSPILFYYTQYKDTGIKSVVEFPNKLGIVAPIILFLVYLGLLISMLKQKFEKTDINIELNDLKIVQDNLDYLVDELVAIYYNSELGNSYKDIEYMFREFIEDFKEN